MRPIPRNAEGKQLKMLPDRKNPIWLGVFFRLFRLTSVGRAATRIAGEHEFAGHRAAAAAISSGSDSWDWPYAYKLAGIHPTCHDGPESLPIEGKTLLP